MSNINIAVHGTVQDANSTNLNVIDILVNVLGKTGFTGADLHLKNDIQAKVAATNGDKIVMITSTEVTRLKSLVATHYDATVQTNMDPIIDGTTV